MKNICEKFCYPYPSDCVYILYFSDKNKNVIYDIVISSEINAILEYIENKEFYGIFKYLGYTNVEVLRRTSNNHSNRFMVIDGNKKEYFNNIDIILSKMKKERVSQGYLIDLSSVAHLKKEVNKAIYGLKCDRTPIYLYSEDEVNEALTE